MNEDDLKQLWKEQPMSTTTLSREELRRCAKRMRRRIAVRNAIEYVACVFVIAGFTFHIVRFPFPLMRIGSVLIILGVLVLVWQMQRRASSQPLPADVGNQTWLDFQRAQLVRQRDALRSAWLWYVMPLVPGMVVFRWGVETELGASAPFVRGWGADLFIALVFVAIALWNRYAAHRLQKRIDKLDRDAR